MKIIYARNIAVKVDNEDYDKLVTFNWYVDNSGYVIAWVPKTKSFLRMHNEVMNYRGEKYSRQGFKTAKEASEAREVFLAMMLSPVIK